MTDAAGPVAAPRPGSGGYRDVHLGAEKAAEYDRDFWSDGSAKASDWQLEQRLLDLVFERHLQPPPARAVDLACGTGRVLSYLERRVADTAGLDISADMLAIARERCPRSRLVESDVAGAGAEIEPGVDLVTSFRFLLNAEPELRADALAWVRTVLRPGGRLVANFHLNPHSLRGGYLLARWGGTPRVPMLTPRQAQSLLAAAGLRMVARYGYQYLPFRRDGAQLRLPGLRGTVERALLDSPVIGAVAGAFVVVAEPV